MKVANDITELIGKTPLIKLESFGENLLGKLEFFNPLSSVKDRIGVSMINKAEKKGLINENTTIVEPTSGNTGIALSFVCAARNYKLKLTMPESMSTERRKLLKALGAELVLTSKEKGMKGAVDKAEELSEKIENSFLPQQFQNLANPYIHRETTGKEIWEDTDGKVERLVAGVGTGGTITGVSEYIKEKKGKEDFQSIAVEPSNSAILSGEEPGSHSIQGIGAGFLPEILKIELIDDIVKVNETEAKEMSRELAKKEGILAGISAGAALEGALKINEKKGNDKLTVVIIPDTGERYLTTDLFEI
ncbi:MAG: cysteine synthase A [Candidatus Hadarchaeota archaeon]